MSELDLLLKVATCEMCANWDPKARAKVAEWRKTAPPDSESDVRGPCYRLTDRLEQRPDVTLEAPASFGCNLWEEAE